MNRSVLLRFALRCLAAVKRVIVGAHVSLDRASPIKLFGTYLFFAMFLFVASAGAGLLTISSRLPVGTRLKGFGWELNWAPNHLVVVPVALLCCGLILKETARLVSAVAGSGMLVDELFEPIPSTVALEDWRRSKINTFWLGVLAVFVLSMSWGEWFVGSFRPIQRGVSAEPQSFLGWTTGRLLDNSINPWANGLLSFVAFTAQAYISLFFLYTLGTTLAFCNWLFRYVVVPDLGSKDDRRRMGFERFQPLIYRFLWFALAFVVSFFLIRIQSLYNASSSPVGTVYQFALDDIVKGFFVAAMEFSRGDFSALLVVGQAANYSTVVVSSACMVLLMVALVLPNVILSILAYQSRENIHQCMQKPRCPAFESRVHDREACLDNLEHMSFWPLRYPRPLELLSFVVFSGFCFFFYKFTFILIGIMTIRMVKVVYDTMTSRPEFGGPSRSEPTPASPPTPDPHATPPVELRKDD